MYPDIAPDLEIRSTISHPLRPEEVIGFLGRNKKLGHTAIVMKADAIDSATVIIPVESAGNLADGEGELVVLDGDEVLTMHGLDFATEHGINTIEGRGSTAQVYLVNRNSDTFRSWDISEVEVGN